MKKERLVLNKPYLVGMCILDLSKTLMYDYHYNYMYNYQKKYSAGPKDCCPLLFTDINSLVYHIETELVYNDFHKDKDLFDNSDYPNLISIFRKKTKK